MPLTEERFHEIDIAVESSGYSYDPFTERFTSSNESESDNNLDFDWKSVGRSIPGVTEEEFQEYCERKRKEGEKEMDQYMPMEDEEPEEP